MATYKVIQDIEAEDKLIGPLTLKQFIFACVAAAFAFLAFLIASKTSAIAFLPFLPFILIPGILAVPLSKDQPTDVWLAAKIRFLIKPRKRIWNQDGIKNLVNITAPKKAEKQLTKNLNQQQVKSRLKALSEIIDSRGWAVKNEILNVSVMPQHDDTDSDRLIALDTLPQNVPTTDVRASDDIMDSKSNVTAQHFDKLMKAAATNKRQAAIERMQNLTKISSQPEPTPEVTDNITFKPKIVAPHQTTSQSAKPNNEETLLLKQIEHNVEQSKKVNQMISPHHKAILSPTSVTTPKNPDIVNLATTDFSVATIASLANRKTLNSKTGG